MPQSPRYTIRTVHDFAMVPVESRETCLREFMLWLEMVDALKGMMQGIPVQLPEAFLWIDDGKHEVSIIITNGEQTIDVASGVMRGFE
jgi:hypothetical protein